MAHGKLLYFYEGTSARPPYYQKSELLALLALRIYCSPTRILQRVASLRILHFIRFGLSPATYMHSVAPLIV